MWKSTKTGRRVGATVVLAASALLALSACSGTPQEGGSDGGGSDCVPAHEFTTLKEGVISVAAAPDRPFADVTSDGRLDFVVGKLMTAIAENECLTLEAVPTTGAGLLQSVISERVDVAVGGWYITEPRGEEVGQTLPILFEVPAIVSEAGFTTWQEVVDSGVDVGVVQGTLWVEDLQKLLGESRVKLYQEGPAMFSDLAVGRIGAVPSGYAEAFGQLEALTGANDKLKVEPSEPDPNFPPSMTQSGIGLPHTLGNDSLTAMLNANIAEFHKSGQIQQWLEEFGIVAEQSRVPAEGTMDSIYQILGADCSAADWADLCAAFDS